MTENIYFTTTNGTLVNNYDIAKTAIISGNFIDGNNFDEVRRYASICKGIIKEIKPSIKRCLRDGNKVTAVKLYYTRHPGIGLKEAKEAVDIMEAKMKKQK